MQKNNSDLEGIDLGMINEYLYYLKHFRSFLEYIL